MLLYAEADSNHGFASCLADMPDMFSMFVFLSLLSHISYMYVETGILGPPQASAAYRKSYLIVTSAGHDASVGPGATQGTRKLATFGKTQNASRGKLTKERDVCKKVFVGIGQKRNVGRPSQSPPPPSRLPAVNMFNTILYILSTCSELHILTQLLSGLQLVNTF